MEAILILSILMLVLSAGVFIQSVVALGDGEYRWIFPCVASSLFMVGTFTCIILSSSYTMAPGESDIINGKAEYREHLHVDGQDTIKTYTMEWVNNKK